MTTFSPWACQKMPVSDCECSEALEEQPLGVGGRGRDDYFQPGDAGKPSLEALGVVRTVASPGAPLGSQHQGHLRLAAEHVVHLGRLVGDLVHGDQHEVAVHVLHHRAHAGRGGADAETGEAGLGDGGVADPLGAEDLEESPGHAEHAPAAPHGDVLAHDEDCGISLHLFTQCVVERLHVGDVLHVRRFG
jgi:hypothetical protein